MMDRLVPYTAPSDIDRHRRDREHLHADQHGFRCQCTYCTERRIDDLFFRALFDCRQHFGSPEAARVLGPSYERPAWLPFVLASCNA